MYTCIRYGIAFFFDKVHLVAMLLLSPERSVCVVQYCFILSIYFSRQSFSAVHTVKQIHIVYNTIMDDEQKQQQQNNAYSFSAYSQQQLQQQQYVQHQQNDNNMQSGSQSRQQSNGYPQPQPQYGYRLIEGVEVASQQQPASTNPQSHVLQYTSPNNGSSTHPSSQQYHQQLQLQQPTQSQGYAAQSSSSHQFGFGAHYNNTSPYQQQQQQQLQHQQQMMSSPSGYASTAQSSRGRSGAYHVNNNLHAANNQQQQQLITPQTSMTPHEYYRSASQAGSVSVSSSYHPSIASSAQQQHQLNIGSSNNHAPPGLVQQIVPPGLLKQNVPPGLVKMNAPPGLTKQQGECKEGSQDVMETALGKAEAAQSQQPTKSYQISDTGRLNKISTAATELTSPKSSNNNNQLSATQAAVAELSPQTAGVAAQLLQQEIINRQNQQSQQQQPRHLSSQEAVVQLQVKVCSMCGNSKKKHSYCVAEWSKEGDGVCNVCIKAEGLDVLKSSAPKKLITASSDATANLPNGVSPKKEKKDDSSPQKVSPQFDNSRGTSSSTSSSINTSPSSKSTRACGNCEACKHPDCGTCSNCLDKPKFGGEHKKKQKCIMRRCPHHENKSKRPSVMSSDDDNDVDEAMEELKERVRMASPKMAATAPVSSTTATTTKEVKSSVAKPAAKPIDKTSIAYLRSLLTKKKSKPTTTTSLKTATTKQQQQMDICIPATFSPKHSYRATAAYSLLRTLSNELRLGPFTLDALTNALMLPLPSKLLGDIHVRLLRVLFANGGLGRNYGEYTRFGDGGVEHIVRKKRIATVNTKKSDNTNADIGTEVVIQEETELIPMQGGNNLSFLDSTTWPLFYQDYANATKDKFHDVMEEGIVGTAGEDDEKVVNNEEFIDVKSEAMQPLVDIDLNPKFILNTTKVEPEWINQCPFGPLGKRNASGLFLCCPFHIHAAIRGYQKVSSAQQGITFSEDKKRKMQELPEKKTRGGRGRPRKSGDSSSGSEFSSAENPDSEDDDYPSPGKKRPRRASSNGGRKRGRPKKVQTSQSQSGGADQKKRVVLTATEGKALLHATPEAKVALRDAILSGIRHPQGKIDPALLKVANSHGLSRKVIMNAAAVARQKALGSASATSSSTSSAESTNKLSFSEQRSQFLGSKVPYFKAAPSDNARALKAAHTVALSSQKEKTEMERRIALAREKAGLPNETVPNPLAAHTGDNVETSASSLDVADPLVKNIRGGGTTGEVVDLTQNEDSTKPATSQQPMSRLVTNATLPKGWTQHVDNKTGKTFYYNKEHKKSTWVKPTKGGSQGTYPPIALSKIPVYGSAHKGAIVVSDKVAQSLEQFLLNGPSSTPSSNTPSIVKSKDESDLPNGDNEGGAPASSADHLLSHMEAVSQLSRGIPYHALSISSKLSMIEFLLDELLQVPEFSYIVSHREAATRIFNSRYGTAPQPKDYEEMINQDECTICGLEGDLLCCDGCPSSVHRACM